MNSQTFAGLCAALLLALAPAGAAAQTFSFTADDLIFEPWVSPYDADEEPLGFRLAGPDGLSLTAFGASPYEWQDTTFVLGFAAVPETAYAVDWAASWLEAGGARIILTEFAPAPASDTGEDWLAAHPWGGNGLDPKTTWVFTAPAFVLDLTGGQIAYRVSSIPEPEGWAMLLAGLGVIGTAARRGARRGAISLRMA